MAATVPTPLAPDHPSWCGQWYILWCAWFVMLIYTHNHALETQSFLCVCVCVCVCVFEGSSFHEGCPVLASNVMVMWSLLVCISIQANQSVIPGSAN